MDWGNANDERIPRFPPWEASNTAFLMKGISVQYSKQWRDDQKNRNEPQYLDSDHKGGICMKRD
jgi:hypothetical protein